LRSGLYILLLLFISIGVHGQTLKGIITDAETGKALFPVIITNNVTQQTVSTDEQGFYSMGASRGDLIYLTFQGYRTMEVHTTPGTDLNIAMQPLSVKLKEFIFKEYTPFQKDSIALSTLYSSELNTRPAKIGFSLANGGGITGLIGAPIKKMSKSYKQNKRFKEHFKSDMEQRYIDTKYTTVLVNALTSFTGDTLATFMNIYPMDYGFARTATDLELKMWIRSNYKDFQHKESLRSSQLEQ
jgi:hypothetical protein